MNRPLLLKMFSFLFLLLLSNQFSSCNQGAMGTANFIANTIGAPLAGIAEVINYFSGNTWQDMKEHTEARRVEQLEIGPVNQCVELRNGETPFSSLVTSMEKVRDQFCTCKEWGTCKKSHCSCDRLCPDTFAILNRGGQESVTSVDNTFSFRNRANDFAGVHEMTGGLCWGIQVLEQKFNRLAFFTKKVIIPFNGDNESDREKRTEYYTALIDRIIRNEAVVIPGVANLREFSNIPEVKAILRDRAGSLWAHYAMGSQGFDSISSSSRRSLRQSTQLFDDLEYRINNHQAATIVINKHGNAHQAHVVSVTDVLTDERGNRSLCIRDPNVEAEDQSNCENQITIAADGGLNYNRIGWGQLGFVQITHNEDADTVQQVRSLHRFCRTNYQCRD